MAKPIAAEKLTDEQLVALVRSDDQELYSEIVRRYQDKLIRYAIYLINNKDKAEETPDDNASNKDEGEKNEEVKEIAQENRPD